MVDKIEIIRREPTEKDITEEQWAMLEDIFMGGTRCYSLTLDSSDWDEEWNELEDRDVSLWRVLKELLKTHGVDGVVEIGRVD